MMSYYFYTKIKRKWLKWGLVLLYDSLMFWIIVCLLLNKSIIIDIAFLFGVFIVGLIVVYGQLTRFYKIRMKKLDGVEDENNKL